MPSTRTGRCGRADRVLIEVEPQELIDAGKRVWTLGQQLSALADATSEMLSGGIASGTDPAGLNFGISYGRQADDFAARLADAANAFTSVGVMLEATGFNYRNADAASTPGGPGPSGGFPGNPARTTTGDAPYGPNGNLVPPPTKWWLITPFLQMIPGFGLVAGAAMTWPTGNPAMMNLTAAQWRNIGDGLTMFEPALAGAKVFVDAQDIPEKGAIKTALEQLGAGVNVLAAVAGGLATAIGDFAAGVQETQDAIRRLLDRISVGGLWDTVTGLLTGDGDRVLREVADDVSTVLANFQNQVRGVLGLLDELKTLLGESADAFQKWIRPVLVGTFGDEAGHRLADGIQLYTDIQVGSVSGLIGSVSGTISLADANTWKGLADTAVMLARDPSKADDVLKQIGSDFIALEQWQGEHPGRGLGEAGFNVASLFVPGGALAKGGSVAKGLSVTRHLLDKMDSGPLRRLPGSAGNRMPDMPHLPDAPVAPDIPAFRPPAGIPESVVTTGGAPTAPMRPQGLNPGLGSSSTSPNSGVGGGHVPTADPPKGPGTGSSNGTAPGGGSPNGTSAPTGVAPNSGGGPSSNGQVPIGGSSDSGGGHGTVGLLSDGSNSGPDGGSRASVQNDPPNNPPHTGLHDPPANHAVAGDRPGDLSEINNEYRLDTGAVDPQRINEWAQRVADEYPGMTKEGVVGVYDYTTANHQGMNAYLRDVDPLSPEQQSILGTDSIANMTAEQRAAWEERIGKTDEGLSSLPPHRADPGDATSTIWCGLHASDELLAQLEVGGTFRDPAYFSTSTESRIAEQFAVTADPGRAPTVLSIEGYNGVDVSQLSRYTDEAEILFPRGSEFEVVSRELGDDGVMRIFLRQVEP